MHLRVGAGDTLGLSKLLANVEVLAQVPIDNLDVEGLPICLSVLATFRVDALLDKRQDLFVNSTDLIYKERLEYVDTHVHPIQDHHLFLGLNLRKRW
jgi:hypothetical protein